MILLQADAGSVIQLTVVHLRLPCGRQWLKVRDGDSLAATLVAHLSGRMTSRSFMSTSNYMLLDFFSDDVPYSCHGTFLARAEQRGNGVAVICRAASLLLQTVSCLDHLKHAPLSMLALLKNPELGWLSAQCSMPQPGRLEYLHLSSSLFPVISST